MSNKLPISDDFADNINVETTVSTKCQSAMHHSFNISAPPGEGRGDHVWVGEVVAEDEEAGVPRLVRHDYDILYTLHFTVYVSTVACSARHSAVRSLLTPGWG